MEPTRRAWPVAALTLAAVAIALSPSFPARGEDPKAKSSGTFSYHPSGSSGQPELCDTRTGTIYRRSMTGTWEVFTRAPE